MTILWASGINEAARLAWLRTTYGLDDLSTVTSISYTEDRSSATRVAAAVASMKTITTTWKTVAEYIVQVSLDEITSTAAVLSLCSTQWSEVQDKIAKAQQDIASQDSQSLQVLADLLDTVHNAVEQQTYALSQASIRHSDLANSVQDPIMMVWRNQNDLASAAYSLRSVTPNNSLLAGEDSFNKETRRLSKAIRGNYTMASECLNAIMTQCQTIIDVDAQFRSTLDTDLDTLNSPLMQAVTAMTTEISKSTSDWQGFTEMIAEVYLTLTLREKLGKAMLEGNRGAYTNLDVIVAEIVGYIVNAPEPYRSVFIKNVGSLQFAQLADGDTAHYNTANGTVYIKLSFPDDPRGKYHTFFHECAHAIDDAESGITGPWQPYSSQNYKDSDGNKIYKDLQQDVRDRIRQSIPAGTPDDQANRVIDAIMSGSVLPPSDPDGELFAMIMKDFWDAFSGRKLDKLGTAAELHTVSDAFDGITDHVTLANGAYGHRDEEPDRNPFKDYWYVLGGIPTRQQEPEFFASYFADQMLNNTVAINFDHEYLPSATSAVGELVQQMADS